MINPREVSLTNWILFLLIGGALVYYLYTKGYILANFTHLSPREAFRMLQKEGDNIIIIDVREPEEVDVEGKIPGSVLIPLGKLPTEVDRLDKSKKIIVYCKNGVRSVSAARFLSSKGFKVYNIEGGIDRWKDDGLPVEK
ncbi:MAG: rhodanese-like domain-containing protein [Aquificae bacterium]|nr:rhodanese-like domain-containing protein [Aquificota bacterium]